MIQTDHFTLLILLIAAHFLCDFAFQSSFMAEAKNRNTELGREWWPWALSGHAAIHAGMVTILTNPWLGLAEFVLHAKLDWEKNEGRSSIDADQFAHLMCKVGWWSISLALASA